MDIKELTKDYKKQSDDFYNWFDGNSEGKREQPEQPNFLKQVIFPILNALPEALPECGFTPPSDNYVMYGEYYRIKCGIIVLGGISVGKNFELYFTTLFHGRPCGRKVEITTLDQLVENLRSIYSQRVKQQ